MARYGHRNSWTCGRLRRACFCRGVGGLRWQHPGGRTLRSCRSAAGWGCVASGNRGCSEQGQAISIGSAYRQRRQTDIVADRCILRRVCSLRAGPLCRCPGCSRRSFACTQHQRHHAGCSVFEGRLSAPARSRCAHLRMERFDVARQDRRSGWALGTGWLVESESRQLHFELRD